MLLCKFNSCVEFSVTIDTQIKKIASQMDGFDWFNCVFSAFQTQWAQYANYSQMSFISIHRISYDTQCRHFRFYRVLQIYWTKCKRRWLNAIVARFEYYMDTTQSWVCFRIKFNFPRIRERKAHCESVQIVIIVN